MYKIYGMLDSAKHKGEKHKAGLLKELSNVMLKMFLVSVWHIINSPLIIVIHINHSFTI